MVGFWRARLISWRGWSALVVGLIAAVSAAVPAVVLASPRPAAAQSDPFVVTTTGDQTDADLNDLVCRTRVDTCTLRAAIQQANHNPGPDRITFAIGEKLNAAGVAVIRPATPLPELYAGDTTIDGYTQPGARPNTLDQGSNAVIRVEIDGTGLEWGLRITSPANTVRGLSIYEASSMILLIGENADGNVIVGNLLGTNAATTHESTSRRVAVDIKLGPDRNAIGRPNPADRNVIIGYYGHGVWINHGETSENVVQNNLIGLPPSLDRAMGGFVGIDVQYWSWGNLVGGFGPMEGNVVSGGQRTSGIDLSHGATGNAVVGNYVGTMPDGNTITALTGNHYGLAVKDGPNNNYWGLNVSGGNDYGIYHTMQYNGSAVFDRNRIGVGVNGGAIGNEVGIVASGHDQLYYRNIIAHNRTKSVWLGNNRNGVQEFDDGTATAKNQWRENTFHHLNARYLPEIDLVPTDGYNSDDAGDADQGPNSLLNRPKITGIGPGKMFGTACAGCDVEVFITGAELPDGSIDPGSLTRGYGRAWIGTASTAANGTWSLADDRLVAGKLTVATATDSSGNTSETTRIKSVPSTHSGIDGVASPSIGAFSAPAQPAAPPVYRPEARTIVSGSITTGTGEPVAGASVELFTDAAGSRGTWISSTLTATDGGYALYPPSGGCWYVTFVAPAGETFAEGGTAWLNRRVCVDEGSSVAADSRLAGAGGSATISGAVVDGTSGVEGLTVDLFTSDTSGARVQWTGSTVTGVDGNFSFDVDPGCWALTYRAPDQSVFITGSVWLNQSICVEDGEAASVDEVVVDSAESAEATGTVGAADGSPVEAVQVDLFTAAADGSRAAYRSTATTDADGRYRLTAPAGCYVEVLIAPDGSTWNTSGTGFLERPFCLETGQVTNRPEALLS